MARIAVPAPTVAIAALLAFALILRVEVGRAQEAPSMGPGPAGQAAPIERVPPPAEPEDAPAHPQPQAGDAPGDASPAYDKAIFQKPISPDQMTFLKHFDGAPSNDLYRDKQFRKLMKIFVPDCTFHYGSDKSMQSALDEVMEGSKEPVRVVDGRYVVLSGRQGPYLAGKGFLWLDTQDGVAMGAFYFHPTNGEPTPVVNVFSRQVQKQILLGESELPPAFLADFEDWAHRSYVPPVTTRYFITGSNKKILLEHDEDYCPGYSGCDQMNADASDKDMDAASYLEQTHHVTNATAWMITGADQVAWLQVRESRCGRLIDPLGCRIEMTRERTRVILHAPPGHRTMGHVAHR